MYTNDPVVRVLPEIKSISEPELGYQNYRILVTIC